MPDSLKDVLVYLCRHHPHPEAFLSKARLTKLVYLADWKSCIENGKQITDIQWYFHQHGPYVPNVIEVAKENPDLFVLKNSINEFFTSKTTVTIKNSSYSYNLSSKTKACLDHVIQNTCDLNFTRFISLVYSTWPVFSGNKHTELNLVECAAEYNMVFSTS